MITTVSAIEDIELDRQGNISLATGMEAVRQHVVWRLRFIQGEWFLQQDAGTPYREGVFAEVDAATAAQLVKSEILKVEGVVDVALIETTIDRHTRKLSVRAEIDTEFGRMDLETEI